MIALRSRSTAAARRRIGARLQLKSHRVYEKTGTVGLEYDIVQR
jgi:hypothetical protein